GRCYFPQDRLAGENLSPADLLNPVTEPQFRRLYNTYLDLAQSHLNAGWIYTNMLPRGQVRVRLACAWPILIGVKTIEKLRTSRILGDAPRVKITRAEVRRLVARSVFWYPWPQRWRKLFPA